LKKPPAVRFPYKSVDWAVCRVMDIPDDEDPSITYLRRFIFFKTPWLGLYLHFIYTVDHDRDPHNHPFTFWSWVVRGGYTERRTECFNPGGVWPKNPTTRTRRRWSIAQTNRRTFHSIRRLDVTPTVTLILTGPRSKWGFLTPEGYVPQEVYIRGKEERWSSMKTP
jgi:hypothetical protein